MQYNFKKTAKIIHDSRCFVDESLRNASDKYQELTFPEADEIRLSIKIIENGHPHILIAGLSKSGKSTLINCLANSKNGLKVSPTRRGAECTTVPSVIEAGKEDIVQIFNKKIRFTHDPQTTSYADELEFQGILNKLRGIDNGNKVQPDEIFNLKDYDKLVKYVTKLGDSDFNDSTKPQLAFISVVPHEESLLSASSIKMSIIDSPGLDGEQAGRDKHPLHSWLQGNVDIIILVHSSLAAVTQDLCQYVHELHSSGRKPVVRRCSKSLFL